MKKFLKVFLIIIIIGFISLMLMGKDDSDNKTNSSSTVAEAEIEYQTISLETLFSDLESNALKAQENYKDKYVEFSGILSTIDSDGSYVCIKAVPDGDYTSEFWLDEIQCYVKGNEDVLNFIKEHSKGDNVTIQGQITEVGELLGYSLNIDTIQ